MHSKTPARVAENLSRKRPMMVAAATLMFLVAQMANQPFFGSPEHLQRQKVAWAINATLLLLGLAGGAVPWFRRRGVRALMNDELTRSYLRTSTAAGFWTAMCTAMLLYWIPASRTMPADAAVYVIVTVSVSVSLFCFAWLEHRAQRDA